MPPWKNWTLPLNVRISDLISRLTLEEKLTQFMTTGADLPRFNISAEHWGYECLHGAVSPTGKIKKDRKK